MMRVERLILGPVEISAFSDGGLRVDGGAMFGVVPRVDWEKKCPPDAANRVPVALNIFLIRTKEVLILVETGIGTLLRRKLLDYYGFSGQPDLEVSLAALGLRPEDVDIVFNSHLHFDHCGGNTRKKEEGSIVPAFPKARYVVQKGEWASAIHPVERDRASYAPVHLSPLQEAGKLDLIEGDQTIAEGVEAVLVPGHTAHHQCLKVTAGGRIFFYLGDLAPTSAHVGLSSIMSFDLYPVETVDQRKKIYKEASAGDWTLGFSHDPDRFFGKVLKKGRTFEFFPTA